MNECWKQLIYIFKLDQNVARIFCLFSYHEVNEWIFGNVHYVTILFYVQRHEYLCVDINKLKMDGNN